MKQQAFIIFIAVTLALSFAGCKQAGKKPNENAAANTDGGAIEKKAKAIAGRWETTTALDDKISFDFSPAIKDSDSYAGSYIFDVNGSKDPAAKYIVSDKMMIKFYNAEGQEYPLIRVAVSGDGNTLTYFDQKDGESKLTRVAASPKQNEAAANREDCTVKNDNTRFFISATERFISLKKGTSLIAVDAPMHQGLIVVRAKIGTEWVQGEVELEDTTCNDEPDKKE